MTAVTLLDYGSGNLHSVRRALEHLDADVRTSAVPEEIARAERLIVPGVGAFGASMAKLASDGFGQAIVADVKRGIPVLGICVGMQVLFSSSDEFGHHTGLDIIPGENNMLNSLSAGDEALKVPHIGWNTLLPSGGRSWSGTILEDLEPGASCYFVHSFAPHPAIASDALADTRYGDNEFCSVVNRDNVWGCQFHPEKSGPIGLKILSAFLRQ